MGFTREDLWLRLERADYFDWCRKVEYKQLKELFFTGVVVEEPGEFITCRELFWSPKQGADHWQATVDLRKRYTSLDGVPQTSDELGKRFVVSSVDSLLQSDFQYVGMSIQQQIELTNFLGAENRPLNHNKIYVGAWIAAVGQWLNGAVRGGYEIPGLSDCKFARCRDWFYGLLNDAPIQFMESKLVVRRVSQGWNEHSGKDFQSFLTQFCKLLGKYRLPKGLECDPAFRLTFVESMIEDLESGRAPEIMQQVWKLSQLKKSK